VAADDQPSAHHQDALNTHVAASRLNQSTETHERNRDVITNPCPLCGTATAARAACGLCAQGLAGFDVSRLADSRTAAAATLYLATRPGVPLGDALCARLRDLAAELEVVPASSLEDAQATADGPYEPFHWVPTAARALVADVVRQMVAERRAADAERQRVMAQRTASVWAVTR
jgi:hypothetical protein